MCSVGIGDKIKQIVQTVFADLKKKINELEHQLLQINVVNGNKLI